MTPQGPQLGNSSFLSCSSASTKAYSMMAPNRVRMQTKMNVSRELSSLEPAEGELSLHI